jgi:hypothetical protein
MWVKCGSNVGQNNVVGLYMAKIMLDKTHPHLIKEWDFEKNKIKPSQISYGSVKPIFWKCEEFGHSWSAKPNSRTSNNTGCPKCSGNEVSKENSLLAKYPEVAKELHKSNSFKANEITAHSNKPAVWECSNCKHRWTTKIQSRTNNQNNRKPSGCPKCSKSIASKNYNLAVVYPERLKYWDYEKNTLKPTDITPLSSEEIYWKCEEGHKFKKSPKSFIRKSRYGNVTKGSGCRKCSGKEVWSGNSFSNQNPLAAKQWVFTCKTQKQKSGCVKCSKKSVWEKNEWNYECNEGRPEDFTVGSSKVKWFKCSKGHYWKVAIGEREKYGCGYCSGRWATKENNLKVVFPEIAKLWDYKLNTDRPEDHTPRSENVKWWKCQFGHKSYEKSIAKHTPNISNKNYIPSGCPQCQLTPRSRDEIYLLFELMLFFNIDPEDHKIKLTRLEDVDIILRDEKIIIEYDGYYWHKNRIDRDKKKTKDFKDAGWTVIRLREKQIGKKTMPILSNKYNIKVNQSEYKNNVNKTLLKIKELGFLVVGLNKYLNRKSLVRRDEAEEYILKLYKKQAEKKLITKKI